jgi:hypothetical protein
VNVSRVDKRCHKNVVPRLDFRGAGSLLVAVERAFWRRDLMDYSVRNRMLRHAYTRVGRTRLPREQECHGRRIPLTLRLISVRRSSRTAS